MTWRPSLRLSPVPGSLLSPRTSPAPSNLQGTKSGERQVGAAWPRSSPSLPEVVGGGGARPSGRQVRPRHPNPERARTCRAALARPTFPGALGPGRKSRNHPGHQDPLLPHLGGGIAARHHAASPTRGGFFLPNSPRRAPRKERHFVSARVRGKEGGGGAQWR